MEKNHASKVGGTDVRKAGPKCRCLLAAQTDDADGYKTDDEKDDVKPEPFEASYGRPHDVYKNFQKQRVLRSVKGKYQRAANCSRSSEKRNIDDAKNRSQSQFLVGNRTLHNGPKQ